MYFCNRFPSETTGVKQLNKTGTFLLLLLICFSRQYCGNSGKVTLNKHLAGVIAGVITCCMIEFQLLNFKDRQQNGERNSFCRTDDSDAVKMDVTHADTQRLTWTFSDGFNSKVQLEI